MFFPSGIITLTTDFGYRDPFVATMKGRILDRLPTAQIVDVTHETSVYWPAEAGFWLSRAYPYFSTGSVHIAVVDPGVGTSRSMIGVEADGHLFLAPNNGLLASVLARVQSPLIHQLDLAHALKRFALSRPSATFHGRDIFAPIAAELAAGRASLADLGPEIKKVAAGQVAEPTVSSAGISGVVITIDHFGNLITNIDERLIRSFKRPGVHVSNQTVPIHRTYGDAKPGDLLALINSFGVIEIAVAEGNGAAILGLGRGSQVQVIDT